MVGKARRVVALALGLALVVGACGGGGGADTPAGTTRTTEDATGAAGEAGPRRLTDVLGPVEVPARAERVIADSVGTLAHLWALGVVPVGAAIPVDISPAYIGAGALDVPNLVAGDGWTLDVEAVLAADPDLVVAVGADYNLDNCERYKAAVTTYCFTDGWATAEDIEATFREIAVAVGREDMAEEVIDAYEARKAALATRIADTDLAERSIAVVRFDAGGFIGVRVEDQSVGVLRELGLRVEGWEGRRLTDGYLQLSEETLQELNAADVLLLTLDDNVDPEEVRTFRSPLWRALEPVAAGRAHVVSAWNGVDLLELGRILDEVEATLVEPAERG